MRSTVLGAALIATAATMIGVAAPAHADTSPVNLPLTDDVSAGLLQSGAVLTGRSASEFTGLRSGKSYYAYVPDQDVYYAAAALSGAKTEKAAINLQDQNSYMMFYKQGDPGATWVPIATGFGPISAGEAPCPIPQSVRDVWQWPAGKVLSTAGLGEQTQKPPTRRVFGGFWVCSSITPGARLLAC